MSDALLSASHVSITFGGLKALTDFSLELMPGNLQGLIGPNGAGKTTLFNVLTGIYRPGGGEIYLRGKLLNGREPHSIAELGMMRTFQNIRIFHNLTILDNVRVAFHTRRTHNFLGALVRSPLHIREEASIREGAHDLLSRVGLGHRAHELASTLPYGDQRRLEIARALAGNPCVLLLDEPAAGLNTQEKLAMGQLIRQLRSDFKLSILLIDHDMGMVMDLCERITVLDYGVTIANGTPSEIQSNPKVIEAYLGVPMSDDEAPGHAVPKGTQHAPA